MRRIHNTNTKHLKRYLNKKFRKPLVSFQDRHQIKPHGLWYSIGHDWLDWCSGEMPHWIGRYQTVLNIDTKKILKLETGEDVINFVNKYKVSMGFEYMYFIDWRAVAKDWSGIEIHNYREIKWSESMLDFGVWFSAWDVSSGCIWDRSILKGYYPVVTPKRYRVLIQKWGLYRMMRLQLDRSIKEYKSRGLL